MPIELLERDEAERNGRSVCTVQKMEVVTKTVDTEPRRGTDGPNKNSVCRQSLEEQERLKKRISHSDSRGRGTSYLWTRYTWYDWRNQVSRTVKSLAGDTIGPAIAMQAQRPMSVGWHTHSV